MGEKHVPLLVHGESPFRHFLLHWILTFLHYGEENNRQPEIFSKEYANSKYVMLLFQIQKQ